jgi:hypothetical protein
VGSLHPLVFSTLFYPVFPGSFSRTVYRTPTHDGARDLAHSISRGLASAQRSVFSDAAAAYTTAQFSFVDAARSLARCLLRCTPSLALHSYSRASAQLCFLRGTCNDVVHGCCSPALCLCQTQCPGLQSEAAPPAAAMSNSLVCFRLFAAALGFTIACFHFFFLSYFLYFWGRSEVVK